jgi:hypothetical protein
MKIAQLKLNNDVIIEIEKDKIFYTLLVNKKNFKAISNTPLFSSKIVKLKKLQPESLKSSVLTALVFLKENTNIPLGMFTLS